VASLLPDRLDAMIRDSETELTRIQTDAVAQTAREQLKLATLQRAKTALTPAVLGVLADLAAVGIKFRQE